MIILYIITELYQFYCISQKPPHILQKWKENLDFQMYNEFYKTYLSHM